MSLLNISLFSCYESDLNAMEDKDMTSANSVREELTVRRKTRKSMPLTIDPNRSRNRNSILNQSFDRFSNLSLNQSNSSCSQSSEQVLNQNIYETDPEVVENSFKDMSFALTGSFSNIDRKEVIDLIVLNGGRVMRKWVKTCHYLIVGENPDEKIVNMALKNHKTLIYEEEYYGFVDKLVKAMNLNNDLFGSD